MDSVVRILKARPLAADERHHLEGLRPRERVVLNGRVSRLLPSQELRGHTHNATLKIRIELIHRIIGQRRIVNEARGRAADGVSVAV